MINYKDVLKTIREALYSYETIYEDKHMISKQVQCLCKVLVDSINKEFDKIRITNDVY